MSWQEYIDGYLVNPGFVAYGAILGEDATLWARSEQLERIRSEEIQAIIKGFTTEGYQSLVSNGLFLAGEKYMVVSGNNRSLYLKRGSGGAAAIKTGKAVLLSVYTDGMPAGVCNSETEKLADLLIESGF